MDLGRACEILTALREGIHPSTGEVLHAEEPCQAPEVIRALFTVAPVLDRAARAAARPRPANAGAPWSDDDNERLVKGFDEGASPTRLASTLGRSVSAVRIRLEHLGKVPPRAGAALQGAR